MKFSKIAVLVMVIPALNSCMWGVPDKQPSGKNIDTLGYTYQNIKRRADDCGSRPDSGCTSAIIKYPVFEKSAPLTDSVTKRLTALFGGKNDTSSRMVELAGNFIKSYDDFKKDRAQDKAVAAYFTLDAYANVIRQDSSLTTLEVGGYDFSGGAHGNTEVTFINWDVKADKNLVLSDIFTAGYEKQLNKIAEIIFRKEENLSITASLKDDYFFKDGVFALNKNFLITPLGIRFLYNIYEIKPYAAGRTDLLIPYFQIKYLLKPHTVVSQYIK